MRSSWLAIFLLLSLLLAGCQPLPLMGYPYFWDYTTTKPNDFDMVGSYKILKVRLDFGLSKSVQEKDSTITLKSDHTAIFDELPGFDDWGEKLICRMSGSAKWKLDETISADQGWSVEFEDFTSTTKPIIRECDPASAAWGMFVLGRHAPYRLYIDVGDPDSDTGIEYRRVEP